jgi:hypothetical protein
LAPELRESFTPAEAGELHAYPIGDVVAFVLLDGPLPADGTTAYGRRRIVRSDPARLTFAGQTERLAAAIAIVAADLSAWPAMRRIAIHGLADAELSASADRITEEIGK